MENNETRWQAGNPKRCGSSQPPTACTVSNKEYAQLLQCVCTAVLAFLTFAARPTGGSTSDHTAYKKRCCKRRLCDGRRLARNSTAHSVPECWRFTRPSPAVVGRVPAADGAGGLAAPPAGPKLQPAAELKCSPG